MLLPGGGEADRAVENVIGRLVTALGDGEDTKLGVRWRLVDGEGRPIGLTGEDLRAAIRRLAAAEEEKNQ